MEDLFKNQDVMSKINLPKGIFIRQFVETDFIVVQKLYEDEGWLTAITKPEESLRAWKNSSISLVAVDESKIIVGLIRALTDCEITTYIAELLVNKNYRGKGLGKSLIDACHHLYPHARLDLLSTESADEFYNRNKFKKINGFRKSYY
ncbi:GNAT family N-acetyltransferase [Clostridium estertheticum]|uniref:GNAT family N-acetyltransferase n=1 Tax=Clostridium estertheticum TaxID=238834 RepID=UPI0013E991BB|nr:GNAT family N-acetyltransferase [Clostridium estertheticum]MBZ9689695.1 GNAT family N-acetyltransferase [Clostridium estertheticum]